MLPVTIEEPLHVRLSGALQPYVADHLSSLPGGHL